MSERSTSYPRKRIPQKFLILPGFRVALAIASSPEMTTELFNGFREHNTAVHLSESDNVQPAIVSCDI